MGIIGLLNLNARCCKIVEKYLWNEGKIIFKLQFYIEPSYQLHTSLRYHRPIRNFNSFFSEKNKFGEYALVKKESE